MCMRPCGTIRHSRRSIEKSITKKSVLEFLEKSDTIVDVLPKDKNSEGFKYTGAISKLKALIRLGATKISEINHDDRSIEGYINVYIFNRTYPDDIIVRIKKG